MGSVFRLFFLCLLGSVWALGGGGGLPAPVFPEGVGVNIHFTRGHERDLDMIAETGFRVVRMDLVWEATERERGRYDWSAYDELTANLERRGLRPYYILDYSNALYEGAEVSRDPISGREHRHTVAPAREESVAAFARWAGAAAAHFKGRGVIWEVWNEPNIGFWRPRPKVEDYAALLSATCRALRAADPDAVIVAPASSEFPWDFLEHLFKDGALEHLDAVSVHPYRNYSMGPETAAADYRRLRALMEKHMPAGRPVPPILSGEWGYSTYRNGGLSLERQADFAVRQQLSNLAAGVPVSIWYDWKNDGPDPAEAEHNFGVVGLDLTPKPAREALRTMVRQLSGCRIARELPAPGECRALLLCDGAGGWKIAAWTSGAPGESILDAGGLADEDVSIVDFHGAPVAADLRAGALHIRHGASPCYITLRRPTPALAAAAAWRLEPAPSALVRAGERDGVRVPLRLENPFGGRLDARFRLSGPPGMEAAEQTLSLGPGESGACVVQATLFERGSTEVAAELSAELRLEEDGVEKQLGTSRQQLHFTVANPLAMEMAPTRDGLRLLLENPAGEPFQGVLRLGAAERPIRLDAGRTRREIVFPAGGEGAPVLHDEAGRVVARGREMRFQALEIPRMDAALDGDGAVDASASLTVCDSPPAGAPFPHCWRLDYRFAAGWRFLRCEPRDPASGRWWQPALPEGTKALGMWIHGDGSGCSLRMRVLDESGQTFQPGGPDLDWVGWRWVTIDLGGLRHAGHWGGANDGVPHGALRLDCPLLVDGLRRETAGCIHISGLFWMK